MFSKKKKETKKIIKKALVSIKELKYQEAIDILEDKRFDEEDHGKKLRLARWAALGMAYQGLSQHEKALEFFEQCINVEKKEFEYLYGATRSAIALEKWDKAKDYYYSLEVMFGDMKIVQHLAPYFYGLEARQKE
ncbi:MAG: hypothetical protein ACTSP4_06665 [Candidatus Hodarchaeales archaeon]